MVGSPTQTIIGRPMLPEAAVHAVVEEHVRTFYFFSVFVLALDLLYLSMYKDCECLGKRNSVFN